MVDVALQQEEDHEKLLVENLPVSENVERETPNSERQMLLRSLGLGTGVCRGVMTPWF